MIYYVIIFGAALFLFERIRPGKPYVKSSRWYTRAVILNITSLTVLWLGSVTWDKWLYGYSLFEMNDYMPAPVNGFIGYFVFTFFFYWWHRARHKSQFLWKVFHQLHHSITRIETLSSFYLHPLDMASSLLLGSITSYIILGLSFESVAWFNLYLGCMAYFIHSNIRAPHQLGYFLQTPQMHRRHHMHNAHDSNYCDIVLWDMIFGTYENQIDPCDKCGFDKGVENRVVDMLLLKDVNK